MKKIIIAIIGTALFIGTLAGDNLKQLSDWSNAQAIGFNVWTLFCLIMIPYVVYLQFKSFRSIKSSIARKETKKEYKTLIINKNKVVLGIVSAGIGVIIFSFYWLAIRPESIRKECFKKASEGEQQMIASEMRAEINGLSITKGDSEKFKNELFKECLSENGFSN